MKIITDSTSDIPLDLLEKYDIDVIPLKYFFGDTEYIDGQGMTTTAFYEKLITSNVLPTTSQPSPDAFVKVFEKYLNQGEEIIGIFISSKLSGTFQSATIAKGMLGSDNIHLIDSKSVTLSAGSIIFEAIRLKGLNLTANEVAITLNRFIEKNTLLAVVDTLKYLQMGGRLSKASATVGTLLNMKPIVSIVDGKVESIGKARGRAKAFEKILEEIHKSPINYNHPIILGHSNDKPLLEQFKKFLIENDIDISYSYESEIGVVVGIHAGPSAVGLSYTKK